MFSIITSLYRSDRYLDRFERELRHFVRYLQQRNLAFEILIIANDPTRREKELAEKFIGQPWFVFVSVGKEPLYATWNRGVSLAKGQAVGFWNADDVRYPEAMTEALTLFKQGAQLVYFPFKIARFLKIFGVFFLARKQLIDKQVPEFNEHTRQEFQRSMLCGPFFMFTKDLYNKAGPFDEQFKIAGDFDWCVRAVKTTDKFVKAKTVAGEFRVDGGGLSSGGSARQVVENNIIYRRYGILDKIQPEDQELAKHYRFEAILFQGHYQRLKNV